VKYCKNVCPEEGVHVRMIFRCICRYG